METLDKEKNKVFVAGVDLLKEWEDKATHKIRMQIKNYLELDNVNFLFGAGSSIILGSISIAVIPKVFYEAIKGIPNKPSVASTAKEEFDSIVSGLQGETVVRFVKWKDKITGDEITGDEIDFPLEKLLNVLVALDYVQEQSKSLISKNYLKEIIKAIKEELFNICDVENLQLNEASLSEDQKKLLKANRFFYHEKFAKKILQRPLNLKRANVFTTNYDLAFDIAFDRQGVHYVNGFTGFHKRTFKPETYEYDLFYPGSTTQGRVTRIEKVIKYFKIHGSLTWVETESASDNVYGIEEWPIHLVRERKEFSRLMIYPSSSKKSYTLDFPYSELFRQFASSITQAQSVLITFGYSFSDEHINDIIYQALTIPSFTLIIIDYKGTLNKEIERLNLLKDPRIIILEGSQLGSIPFFVEQVLPDFIEENIHEKVSETLRNIYDIKNPLNPSKEADKVIVEEPPKVVGEDRAKPVEGDGKEITPVIKLDDLPF